MGGNILSIGVSGMMANQRALQTTSHNVSNANTDGYSRQRIEFNTRPPQFIGGGYAGTGVQTQAVERIYDNFLNNQVSVYNSSASHAETYARHASLVDELMADPEVGMMPAMEEYFAAVNDVSNDPASVPARQALLSQMETLSDRFNYIDQRLTNVRAQVNTQVKDFISEINALAEGIATTNRTIVNSPKGAGAPNDLLDERDRLLGLLAEKVSVTTVAQDDGSMNVFVGSGQTLVVGFDANSLEVKPNRFDVTQYEVGLGVGDGTTIDVTRQITGGELGGVLEFRKDLLDTAQNQLGKLAMGLAQTANTQHRLGQDLNGNFGRDVFQISELEVLPGTGVANVVSATLDDVTELTGSEYLLAYDGANYTLRREIDQRVTNLTTLPATVDGFTLNIGAGMVAGDQVLIRPTRQGGQDIAALVKDPREVAAGAPVMSSANSSNTGTADISAGSIAYTSNLPLSTAVSLTYDAGANAFVVGGAVPAVSPVAFSSGASFAVNGMEFQVTGVPAHGDQFVIDNSPNSVSDNRNMLKMADLQTSSILDGGESTYQEVYGQLVVDVGIKTNQAVTTERAQSNLLEQAQKAQQSYSGVNMDEEAANLMKYQQAYQASAQVISTANTIFDTLLSAMRR